MAFDINRFNSNMGKYGVTKQSHYEVLILSPAFGDNSSPFQSVDFNRHLMLRADSCDVPGLVLGTTEYRSYGPQRKIVYNSIYDNVNMSFLCSHNLREKVFIEDWMHFIAGREENRTTNNIRYYDHYKSQVLINIYNEENKKSQYLLRLNDAYPVSISPINMSYASQDLVRLQVSFAYHTWERLEWQDSTLPTFNFFSLNPGNILRNIRIPFFS